MNNINEKCSSFVVASCKRMIDAGILEHEKLGSFEVNSTVKRGT